MVCEIFINEENLSANLVNRGNALAVICRKFLLEPRMSYLGKID